MCRLYYNPNANHADGVIAGAARQRCVTALFVVAIKVVAALPDATAGAANMRSAHVQTLL
jgi:hypothetical protein